MDAAVAIVEAYLYTNGYFTVTEYPIVEELEDGSFREVTDIDVLAVRLPGAGRILPSEGKDTALKKRLYDPDPRLIRTENDKRIDFIIGEVKEGRAMLNRGARDPDTLLTAIRRFAFIEPTEAQRIVESLVEKGHAHMPDHNVQWRLFAFAGRPPDHPKTRFEVILLKHCLEYMVRIGVDHKIFNAAQIKNPTFNLLTILTKTGFLRKEPTSDEADAPKRRRKRR